MNILFDPTYYTEGRNELHKKGGGGGFDAEPMIEYGEKALALQKEMYEEGKDLAQPWYRAGVSAIDELQNLLGLTRSESQIRSELLPQYTTQVEQSLGGGSGFNYDMFREDAGDYWRGGSFGTDRFKGGEASDARIDRYLDDLMMASSSSDTNVRNAAREERENLMRQYWNDAPRTQMVDQVDQAGLDAAIAEAMANQGTSDTFGMLTQRFGAEDFEKDPSYQFRLDEGRKALERQLAASGKSFTPEAMKALDAYSQGMASQEYAAAFGRDMAEDTNIYNRLANMAGMGQTSSGQMMQAGQNYANQGANTLSQIGNAITSAQVAEASQPSMFDSLVGIGLQGAQVAGGLGWSPFGP